MKINDTPGHWTMELTMESLNIPPGFIYPAFVFGTLTYVMILFCNILVFTTIILTKSLHSPMFILLLNLPVLDVMGATALLPQLLHSIVSNDRSISYPGCFLQALLLHIYASGNFLFLTAMAYDRYIAICLPLRYHSLMSSNILIRIIVVVWLFDIFILAVLFGISTRFKFCMNNIVDVFCNNPSLVKLVCGDSSVNNYYGLFTIILIQGGSLIIVTYTYIQILVTCLKTKQSDARGKALQTCGTHLIVFLLLEINALIAMLSHRFESVSPHLRRAIGLSIILFPPVLNPLIYGLNTKELQKNMIKIIKRARLTFFI
ncbi:olfactory receptor 56A4-like [Gadus chalcogrammus]|uniref:olfactory receptor 56A4-like n=1 Tax=Gadus chalcogrammus TaxID=1042646 RepID=UPI0024C4A3CB|nr:olfactory receptor 56A4-like [Gadus chalcogrammus]